MISYLLLTMLAYIDIYRRPYRQKTKTILGNERIDLGFRMEFIADDVLSA